MYIELSVLEQNALINFAKEINNNKAFPANLSAIINKVNASSIELDEEEIETLFEWIEANSTSIFKVSWESDIPNNDGYLEVKELEGKYFIFSEDFPCQDPIESWDSLLEHEYFGENISIDFEVKSSVLNESVLEKMAKGMVDPEIEELAIVINEQPYTYQDGEINKVS